MEVSLAVLKKKKKKKSRRIFPVHDDSYTDVAQLETEEDQRKLNLAAREKSMNVPHHMTI